MEPISSDEKRDPADDDLEREGEESFPASDPPASGSPSAPA